MDVHILKISRAYGKIVSTWFVGERNIQTQTHTRTPTMIANYLLGNLNEILIEFD